MDLYLIFDYNVNKPLLDRYDSIKNAHPFTNNCKPIRDNIVNNFEELVEEIKKERKRFNEF